jgi:hypothetical protein
MFDEETGKVPSPYPCVRRDFLERTRGPSTSGGRAGGIEWRLFPCGCRGIEGKPPCTEGELLFTTACQLHADELPKQGPSNVAESLVFNALSGRKGTALERDEIREAVRGLYGSSPEYERLEALIDLSIDGLAAQGLLTFVDGRYRIRE